LSEGRTGGEKRPRKKVSPLIKKKGGKTKGNHRQARQKRKECGVPTNPGEKFFILKLGGQPHHQLIINPTTKAATWGKAEENGATTKSLDNARQQKLAEKSPAGKKQKKLTTKIHLWKKRKPKRSTIARTRGREKSEQAILEKKNPLEGGVAEEARWEKKRKMLQVV